VRFTHIVKQLATRKPAERQVDRCDFNGRRLHISATFEEVLLQEEINGMSLGDAKSNCPIIARLDSTASAEETPRSRDASHSRVVVPPPWTCN